MSIWDRHAADADEISDAINQGQRDLVRAMRAAGRSEEEIAAVVGGETTGRVTMTGESGTWNKTDDVGVSDIALDRQEQSDALMEKHGFAVANTAVTRGKRVNGYGVDKFTREGEQLAALPLIEDSLRDVASIIELEDRRSRLFDVRDARLDFRDGQLYFRQAGATYDDGSEKPGVPANAQVIAAYCEYLPDVMAKIKPALIADYKDGGFSPEETAEQFNRYVVDRVSRQVFRRGSHEKLLWVRRQGEDRAWQTFTMTSTRHTSQELDGAGFAALMADALEGSGMRGEAQYDADKGSVKFNAWTMPNHMVDLSAGDVFKVGLSGGTSDTKKGKFWLDGNVIRNLCLNLMILQRGKKRMVELTHSTKAHKVRAALRSGLEVGDAMVKDFQDMWGILRSTPVEVVNEEGEQLSTLDVLKELAREVKIPGVKRDAIVEAVLTGFEAEPGDSWADLMNAVTRAHLAKDIDDFVLAQEAGRLLPVLAKRAGE